MDYEFDSDMPDYYRRAFNRWHRCHCESPGGRDRRFRCASSSCGSPGLQFVAFRHYNRDGETDWYAELKCEDCHATSYVILSPNAKHDGYTIESTNLWYYDGSFEEIMENRRNNYSFKLWAERKKNKTQ